MNENVKNGLLWAAAALGVLWLIQGLLRGVSGLLFGGFGGREMGMNRGGGFEGKHGMDGGGMPHGGGYESFESLSFIVVVAIIAIIVWAIVSKKKKKQQEQQEPLVEASEAQSPKDENTEENVQVNDDEENKASEFNDSNNEIK